jgi:hypothetical protein
LNDINNRTNKALNGVAMAFAMADVSSLLPSETFAITANWASPRVKAARPSTRPSGSATRCSSMMASARVIPRKVSVIGTSTNSVSTEVDVGAAPVNIAIFA